MSGNTDEVCVLINSYFTWTLITLVDVEGLHSRIPSSLGALKSRSAACSLSPRWDEGGTSVTDPQANDFISSIIYFENIGSFWFFIYISWVFYTEH